MRRQVTGVAIKFNPPIPRLDGMTQAEKDRALERFMRESTRKINLICDNYERRIKELEKNGN
jgi:hypothetical protein